MQSGEKLYIWQADDWPEWRYDLARLAGPQADITTYSSSPNRNFP